MRRFLLLGVALLLTSIAEPAAGNDFFVFPVKISLPVRVVVGGKIITKKLKEKDIVNLALGRPLGTKVDKKREILAFSAARYPEDALEARLIVFDPSQNGLAQVTTVVAEPTVIDRDLAVLANGTQGFGSVTGEVHETTLGDPAKNALHATTLWMSGAGKEKNHKGSVSGIVAGRVSFTTTEKGQTSTFSGFLVKGKAKLPVKLMGMYSDGVVFVGCGDGIVQPNLGEECEYNHQEACPGHCSACTCVVCGNDRRDPGEICDGTDKDICDQLGNSTGCKTDCTGCEQCGDGNVGPLEECDPSAPDQCPGSVCLFPECVCGCVPGVPTSCPGIECCNSQTHRCCDPATTGCGGTEACCGGPGSIPGGLCNGIVQPGAPCPDHPPGGCFECNVCDGKNITATCTVDGMCTWDSP